MKVITEAILRDQLRATEPTNYYIPEGKILSPAAREYLQQRKIKISKEAAPETVVVATDVPPMPTVDTSNQMRFVDFETGGFYPEKPEHMTHLSGNVLVGKGHPRIEFRGKLDSLQAMVVMTQADVFEKGDGQGLIEELGDILNVLREMMRCDVLEEPFVNQSIIGLNHGQLREHSHNPMKFYKIQQMVLPDYTMGKTYAQLNQIRTAIRETEVSANLAFRQGRQCTRLDIVETLNRLSSALHIMMCKYLAGEYQKGGR